MGRRRTVIINDDPALKPDYVTPEEAERLKASMHRVKFRDELDLTCAKCEGQPLRSLCNACFDKVVFGFGLQNEGHWWQLS